MRILIAEDEALVAMMLALEAEEAGAQVLGPVETCAQALALARAGRAEGAILDVQLADGDVTAAAEALLRRGAKVLFHTASAIPKALVRRYGELPVIAKPAEPSFIVRRLMALIERADTNLEPGRASRSCSPPV